MLSRLPQSQNTLQAISVLLTEATLLSITNVIEQHGLT